MKRSSPDFTELADTYYARAPRSAPAPVLIPLLPELWLGPILSPLLTLYKVRTPIMLRRTCRFFRKYIPEPVVDSEKLGIEVEAMCRDNIIAPLSWRLHFYWTDKRFEPNWNAITITKEEYYELLKIPLRLGRPLAFWQMIIAYAPILNYLMKESEYFEAFGELTTAASQAPDADVIQTVAFMQRFERDNYWAAWLLDYVLNLEVFKKRRWILFHYLMTEHFDCIVDYLIESEWFDDFEDHVKWCTGFSNDGDTRWAQLYFPKLLKKFAFMEHFDGTPLLTTIADVLASEPL
jgi:hypothetical protein